MHDHVLVNTRILLLNGRDEALNVGSFPLHAEVVQNSFDEIAFAMGQIYPRFRFFIYKIHQISV